MADRSISVTLKANIAGYMASLRTAGRETKSFGKTVAENSQAAQQLGQSMATFGAGVVGAMALATKAAIDWESAWTGVTKTVDGSAQEMAQLEGELRGLAKTLPVSHQEIASVAEAAGQLGIQRESITEFTRTMIDLGQTTNLAADEAATSLARFMNVMGTSTDDVDRLGSSVVALGNSSATTEAEIVEMATRMAGAGNLIGASETDVLAMAAAMSSVGITAELGGSAMSRVLQDIYGKAQSGGDAVEDFAKVAGMSADEFARAFEEDPVRAFNAFIGGLNEMEAQGGNVISTLQELGIRSSEEQRVILSLKGANDLLTDSLGLSADAWEENTALTDEAQKRYDTAASRIQVAWNQIKDAAIEVGGALAPVVSNLADLVGGLASAFGSLPGPVKSAVGLLGSAVGIAALLGGGLLMLIPRIKETRDAMSALNLSVGKMSKFAGIAGLALTVGVSILGQWMSANQEAEASADSFADTLDEQTGAVTRNTRAHAANRLEELGVLEAAKRLGVSLELVTDAALGTAGAQERLNAALAASEPDKGSDEYVGFAQDVLTLRNALGDVGGEFEEGQEKAKRHAEALGEVDSQTQGLSPDQQALADKFGATADEIGGATSELEAYLEQLRLATDPMFRLLDSLERVDEAQGAYNEAVRQYGANSREARGASVDLAEAVAAAEQAAIEGEDSYEAFRDKLDQWVAQGVLTVGQARSIRQRVDEARKAGERYAKNYNATITARDNASSKIKEIQRTIDSLSGKTVRIRTVLESGGSYTTNFGNRGSRGGAFADGGQIQGPGGPKEDRVPIWASNGEFMQPASSVSYYGVGFMEAIRKRQLPKFAAGGLVDVNVRMPSGRAIEDATARHAGKSFMDWMGSFGGGGAGVERWRGVALRALAMTGSPLSWIGSLLRRMNQESGGNPRAINLWDSNARRGTPSKGLMQTIDPTFYAYAGSLAPLGPYNPLANIVASIRYANARYGAAPVGWNRPGGYRYGTDHVPADGFYKLHRGEQVVPTDRRQGTQDLNLRITGGQLEIVDRRGALIGMMRNVSVQEMEDHNAWAGR